MLLSNENVIKHRYKETNYNSTNTADQNTKPVQRKNNKDIN